MGLFDNEEAERERRRAAEAAEEAEWHKRRAAESRQRVREAELEHEEEMEWRRETKVKKGDIKAIAASGRGDAILELVHEYEKHGDLYNAKTLINAWQVPRDKENFLLFAQTFDINYDYFKQQDWEKSELMAYIQSRLGGQVELKGLRGMLLAKAKKVEKVYLKGQVPEAMALLQDVEDRFLNEGKKELNEIKWYFIALVCIFLFMGIMATCEN